MSECIQLSPKACTSSYILSTSLEDLFAAEVAAVHAAVTEGVHMNSSSKKHKLRKKALDSNAMCICIVKKARMEQLE